MILFFLFSNIACTNKGISIEGTINREGCLSVAVIKESATSRVEEEIALVNGSFLYHSLPDSFELITLKVPGMPFTFPFSVEQGKRVSFSISSDSIANVKITGDDASSELCALRHSLLPLIDEANAIRCFIDSIYQKDTLDYYQALVTIDSTQMVDNRMIDLYLPFIEKHANSLYADIALADIISATGRMLPLNSYIKRQAKRPNASFMAKEIYHNYINATFSRKGETLPEFIYRDPMGELRNFTASRRGKPTLVTFWDASEKYSRFVVKQISDMIKNVDNTRLHVYAIALSDDWKSVKKDLDTMKLKQKTGVSSIYKEALFRKEIKHSSLPYTMFIESNDMISFTQPSVKELEECIKPYMKEEKKKNKKRSISLGNGKKKENQ